MVPDVLHEGRSPGADGDRVEEQQAPVVAAVQEVRAQDRRTAEVVGDDIGRLEAPVLEQRRENLVLHAQGDVLALPHLGLPVA